ncbi:MAG: PD-(D/E)XK nuclease family transposase [Solobacterium sp.]|nr:PD-(D/E)XK nuclease family transposase [Solobacterium sp.]
MFCTVLGQYPNLAKELLELIIGKEINHLVNIQTQKIMNYLHDTKHVRFDVYLEDENGTIYDLEMETTGNPGKLNMLVRRGRYYASALDTGIHREGTKYKDLRDIYVIYVCANDPFPPNGLVRYTFTFNC